MSYRLRPKDITIPVAPLVALVALGLALVPMLPLAPQVCLGLAILSILGLLLYRLKSRAEKSDSIKETRLDSVVTLSDPTSPPQSPSPPTTTEFVRQLRSITASPSPSSSPSTSEQLARQLRSND